MGFCYHPANDLVLDNLFCKVPHYAHLPRFLSTNSPHNAPGHHCFHSHLLTHTSDDKDLVILIQHANNPLQPTQTDKRTKPPHNTPHVDDPLEPILVATAFMKHHWRHLDKESHNLTPVFILLLPEQNCNLKTSRRENRQEMRDKVAKEVTVKKHYYTP